jgi:type IV pilus assembly protein PilB
MTEDAEGSARRLAERHGLRFVDLTQSALAPSAASLLPEDVARRHHAVPIGRRLGTPVIAVSDPGDLFAMDALRASVGREYVAVVARPDQVDRAILHLYTPSEPDAPAAAADGRGDDLASEDSDLGTGAQAGLALDQVIAPGTDGGSGGTVTGGHSEESNGYGEFDAVDGASRPVHGGTGLVDTDSDLHVGTGPSHAAPEDTLSEVLEPPPAWTDGDGTGPAEDAASTPTADNDEATAPGDGPLPPPVPLGYGLVEPSEPNATQDAVFEGPPLARVLVESGQVSPEEMAIALRAHQESGESLARYLYNNHMATEEDLVQAMAQEVGLEYVDLSNFPIDSRASSLIPDAVAQHHMVLPIAIEGGVPIVAMANPTDVFAMDDLRTIMGRNFTPVVATRTQIAMHLRLARDADVDVAGVAEDAAGGIGDSASGFEIESLQSVVEDAPIVRYVNLLILQALNERASDIHIEPTPKRLRIRFRIDGVMHDATSASPSIHGAVVSRLKVLGEMDIAEHRVPQEGRVSLSVSDRQIDLRLATLPSLFGETCVMRLLDKSASIRSLPDLGFYPDTLERYSQAYKHPYGVILVTGPTGAGKTTTVYGTLQEVMSKEKSVVTVEDPVEYQIDGITQVQINQKAGLDFASALRSILRSDPDIVLIGEIRDISTATIAMEAALSGHLVLTTLHTNTAAATPLRLTEMGIEPFLVISSVTGVLTQRLARVLCKKCKEPYEASEKEFLAAGYKEPDLEGIDTSTLYRAVGCRSCSHTGYLGRMVLAEVLNMTEEIDRMIIEQQSISNIEREACNQGMRTLRMDGLMKVIDGQTTLQEVLRVVI